MTLACHRTCIIKQYAHAALVIGHESVHQTTSSCLITAGRNVLCRSSLLKVKQSAHSSGQRITNTHAAEYRVTISKVGWKYLKHENLTIAMKTKRQKKTAETTSYYNKKLEIPSHINYFVLLERLLKCFSQYLKSRTNILTTQHKSLRLYVEIKNRYWFSECSHFKVIQHQVLYHFEASINCMTSCTTFKYNLNLCKTIFFEKLTPAKIDLGYI